MKIIKKKKERRGEWLTDEWQEDEEEEKAGISPEKSVEGGVEDGEWRDEGGEDDLGGQDAIDLANETPTELVLAIADTRVKSALF